MLPTLREVLVLPSFRSASVEVVTGDLEAAVRWVHSSEVYEMGGLLAGGEVLLTTGLGLHGRSADQLTAYVERLADAGCVGLGMEVGRSFFDVPVELVEAAQRRGLAFLAFHAVVPFERMVEDFHDLLVRRKLGSARAGEAIWQELLAPVTLGQGMSALLDAVARLAGCGVELLDTDGAVVERSRIAVPSAEEQVTVDVRIPAGSAGRLVLRGRSSTRRAAVANRAAVAVALELGRHPGVGQRPSLAQAVVTDLVTGSLVSAGDLHARLSSVGWTPVAGQHVLVAGVEIDPSVPAHELLPQVRDSVQPVLGQCVTGVAGSQVLLLAHGWQRAAPQRVRASFTEVYDGLLAAAGDLAAHVRTLAVAPPAADLADVGSAVALVRDVAQIARRFGARTGVVMARDVGVQRLLASGAGPQAVSGFVSEQLGPLLLHDTQTRADLVRTLDAFVAHGGSKARTAATLGIRRQSLYTRLARIERLLGVSLDEASQLTCLAVALTAWRMRTGLDLQAAFDRRPAP